MILDADWNIITEKKLKEIIKEKEIIIFGDSKRNSIIYSIVPSSCVVCILDNNEEKWGDLSQNIEVVRPVLHENCTLLSAVTDCTALISQLRNLGYKQWYFFIDDSIYEKRFSKATGFMQEAKSDFVWKDKHYRYIHIMPDQKFIYPLSKVLEQGMDIKEHAFLMYGFNESNPHDMYSMWKLYKRMSQEYSNIALVGDLYNFDKYNEKRLKVIKDKLSKCEKIIFHGEWLNDWVFDFFKNQINLVKEKGCLIVWSGSFGDDKQNDRYINELLRYCHLIYYRMNNEVLKNVIRKISFPPYTEFLREGPSYSVPARRPERYHNSRPKVLIAHSCFPYNCALEALERLKPYHEEIDVYCCGSYGDFDYIEQVKRYGDSFYGKNFHFIDQYLSYDKYLALINEMDVAFFAENLAGGATTIRMLAYAGKKIYLNSVVAKKFENEGIKTYDLNLPAEYNYDDFIINKYEEENYYAVKMFFDIGSSVALWRRIFEYDFRS